MLATEHRSCAASNLSGWASRDRAAKVAAAAGTLAAGWDRLDERELGRLFDALDDHGRAYAEWVGSLRGPEVHDVVGLLTTMLSANSMLREATDDDARQRLAAMLARAAAKLVARIDLAEQPGTIDLG